MSDRKQKKHGYVECLKYMHMIKEGRSFPDFVIVSPKNPR